VRFQDAAVDARAVVYQRIQADPVVARAGGLLTDAGPHERLLARAVMNGERTEAGTWRVMFPGLFASPDPAVRERAEAILEVSLDVAGRGDQARSQYRGAIVEAMTERILARRSGSVRRERRILFDGVAAEIHPYDVTVEGEPPEAYDCKWGARGINADVLLQLDAAREHAAAEGVRLAVSLVVFDALRSCLVRLARQTAPASEIRLSALETLHELAAGPPRRRARPR
jgi:hypothetical protein